MDKNRIRGLPGRTSEQLIAKSRVINDRVYLAAQTAGSPHGPWRLSNSPALAAALSNAYLNSLGLASLAPRLAA